MLTSFRPNNILNYPVTRFLARACAVCRSIRANISTFMSLSYAFRLIYWTYVLKWRLDGRRQSGAFLPNFTDAHVASFAPVLLTISIETFTTLCLISITGENTPGRLPGKYLCRLVTVAAVSLYNCTKENASHPPWEAFF